MFYLSNPTILAILEVSRKQDYIFASTELKENVQRSAEIAYVTSSKFFQEAAGSLYSEAENLVYAGGGHTVLQFGSTEQAKKFACVVTETALRRYSRMEIFVKLKEYDPARTPGENLAALSAALEEKKARRQASFRWASFGVEGAETMEEHDREKDRMLEDVLDLPGPAGWYYPTRFDEIAGKDNFIAVVHIDGNAMGKRVQGIYETCKTDWDACRRALQAFSAGIQQDFEDTFCGTADALTDAGLDGVEPPVLPLRPVILAGDDVCFVARGELGLECAHLFLEHLTQRINGQDQMPYAACAGVALVHTKFPFHMAYDLAEQLCSSAKKFGAEIDAESRVSAMDWHIEYGQLKESLGDIRDDYIAEDGSVMTLRPVTVVTPEGVPKQALQTVAAGVRTWDFFRAMCSELRKGYKDVPRSKLKELRTAIKQGKRETSFVIRNSQISAMLYHAFDAKHNTLAEQMAVYRRDQRDGDMARSVRAEKTAFQTVDGKEHCLFFDAIEMMDHCVLLGKEETEG